MLICCIFVLSVQKPAVFVIPLTFLLGFSILVHGLSNNSHVVTASIDPDEGVIKGNEGGGENIQQKPIEEKKKDGGENKNGKGEDGGENKNGKGEDGGENKNGKGEDGGEKDSKQSDRKRHDEGCDTSSITTGDDDKDDNTENIIQPEERATRETTLTIGKILDEADRKLISGATFRISPNPYTLDGSLIVHDNDDKLDCNLTKGVILLKNIRFYPYIIQDIKSSSSSSFPVHQAEISINKNLPNPILNFVDEGNLIKQRSEEKFQIIPNQYIIALQDDILEDPKSVADQFSAKGASVLHIYDTIFKGLAISVKDQGLFKEILNDSRVAFIGQDMMGHLASVHSTDGIDSKNKNGSDKQIDNIRQLQTIPTGINRVDADLISAISIPEDHEHKTNNNINNDSSNESSNDNGGDDEVVPGMEEVNIEKNMVALDNVDIAILDTGIVLDHPDLNVYRDVSFIKGTKTGDDDQGHGSHIAGTAAAKNNALGVVGVAPGARLWAVKVCDRLSNCPLSDQLEGIEYVTEHADEIDVANISFENPISPILDRAINESVAAGVTFVVAAGNDGNDASYYSPGNNPAVITVSAIDDSDGSCGGKGRPTFIGVDDTFADFSNLGSAVDMAAPGVDILSTYKDSNEFAVRSGTSTAAPHVTGAVALYKASYPSASPSEVRDAIRSAASVATTTCDGNGHGYFQGDKDGFNEPLLYIAR